jgi:hypothetical protein
MKDRGVGTIVPSAALKKIFVDLMKKKWTFKGLGTKSKNSHEHRMYNEDQINDLLQNMHEKKN